jgi:hypothetical protein
MRGQGMRFGMRGCVNNARIERLANDDLTEGDES